MSILEKIAAASTETKAEEMFGGTCLIDSCKTVAQRKINVSKNRYIKLPTSTEYNSVIGYLVSNNQELLWPTGIPDEFYRDNARNRVVYLV